LILAGHLLLLSALVVLIYIAIYEDTQNYSSYAYGGGFQRARMAPWWSPRRPTLIMPAMR
jgi:hypothetical protein